MSNVRKLVPFNPGLSVVRWAGLNVHCEIRMEGSHYLSLLTRDPSVLQISRVTCPLIIQSVLPKDPSPVATGGQGFRESPLQGFLSFPVETKCVHQHTVTVSYCQIPQTFCPGPQFHHLGITACHLIISFSRPLRLPPTYCFISVLDASQRLPPHTQL